MCFKLSSVILVFLNQVNDNPKNRGEAISSPLCGGSYSIQRIDWFVSYAKRIY